MTTRTEWRVRWKTRTFVPMTKSFAADEKRAREFVDELARDSRSQVIVLESRQVTTTDWTET